MRRGMMWLVVVLLAVGVAAPALSGLPIPAAPDPLVMMSLPPCAIFDTRTAAAGPMAGGETRSFGIVGSGDFTSQGGPGAGCLVPGFAGGEAQARAVLLNLVAISPAGGGNLKAWAGDAPEASGGVVNYQALSPAMNNSNAIVVELNQTAAGNDIAVKANGAGVHVRGVVLGYFVSGHDTSLDTFVIAAAKMIGDQSPYQSIIPPGGALLVESTFTTRVPSDAVVTASVGFHNFNVGPIVPVFIWLELDTSGDQEQCADWIRAGFNAGQHRSAFRRSDIPPESSAEITLTAPLPLVTAGTHTVALCAQSYDHDIDVHVAGLTGVVSGSLSNDITTEIIPP